MLILFENHLCFGSVAANTDAIDLIETILLIPEQTLRAVLIILYGKIDEIFSNFGIFF